jgi:hypothetical protein
LFTLAIVSPYVMARLPIYYYGIPCQVGKIDEQFESLLRDKDYAVGFVRRSRIATIARFA